ncbi:helix-turn-helix transcriptional regulator [Streptomyces microflavus]|uniref:Helix-turn-helix transcriptional regulator n=2 Tax=Streptomyces microflavus TaxID=1919 RepID=A0ABV1PV44_STRMI
MGTEQPRHPALVELRSRLETGRIARGLNKTQLASRAGLGRTVVSQALGTSAPPPSPETVAGLARALGLDVPPLLDLLTTAAGLSGDTASVLGQPITHWDPHDLEVHPAAEAPAHGLGRKDLSGGFRASRSAPLPGYVRRPHDEELADIVSAAANGHSQMAILIGFSSTGKTRACWEAVQPLAAEGWRLWHPFDPTRAEAALTELERVTPRTVVWLNEAQHYIGAGHGVGERIAAALRALLSDSKRQPVLVLGTLWPEYATSYCALPQPLQEDPHAQARELLAGRRITLPETFDATAINVAETLADAGDRQLSHALAHARDGRLTQYLAGAPELLQRYETAAPPARALLHAAMDARRLGASLHLPLAFLEQAASDYLTEDEYSALADNWLEQALADSTSPVHGNLAPLRRVRLRQAHRAETSAVPDQTMYRLTDYLEQHARRQRRMLCPPASFWQAACDHIAPFEDLTNLAKAAQRRHRIRWAVRLLHMATRDGSRSREGSSSMLQLGVRIGAFRDPFTLAQLARMQERAGDQEGAETLLHFAAKSGSTFALEQLAEMRMRAGDQEGAEKLLHRAARSGDTFTSHLDQFRETTDQEEAERLDRQVAEFAIPSALSEPAKAQECTGDHMEAEHLAHQAAESGNPDGLIRLAWKRESEGDREGAELYLRQAIHAGSKYALRELARIRGAVGDHEEAETLLRRAIDAGSAYTLGQLTELREASGNQEGAERAAHEALDAGSTYVLRRLSLRRGAGGDQVGAERLARQAALAGGLIALTELAEQWDKGGDRAGAERLARQAADAGDSSAVQLLGLWPFGLEADGTPSGPWDAHSVARLFDGPTSSTN